MSLLRVDLRHTRIGWAEVGGHLDGLLKTLCRLRVSPLEEPHLADRQIRLALLGVELQSFLELCGGFFFLDWEK